MARWTFFIPAGTRCDQSVCGKSRLEEIAEEYTGDDAEKTRQILFKEHGQHLVITIDGRKAPSADQSLV